MRPKGGTLLRKGERIVALNGARLVSADGAGGSATGSWAGLVESRLKLLLQSAPKPSLKRPQEAKAPRESQAKADIAREKERVHTQIFATMHEQRSARAHTRWSADNSFPIPIVSDVLSTYLMLNAEKWAIFSLDDL